MLSKSQKDLLRSVGRKPNTPDLGKPNPQLDQVIEQLKRDNPKAFLSDGDLSARIFMDEPKDPKIIHSGYIYAIGER